MNIICIHPSRGRSEMAVKTAKKWIDNADSDIEYLMLLDKDDYQKYVPHYQELYKRKDCNFWVAEPKEHKSAIEAINYGAEIANSKNRFPFDLLVVVSDDFDCTPHWDTLLLEALKGKSDFIVKTKDGLQPTLITLPIMDRAYYNRFGYVYHPSYVHMFSDQEMTAVGEMTGKVIKLDLEFKHLHYTTGAMKKDAINKKNDATWRQGERLFNERLKTNFGLSDEQIVKPYNQIVWH